MKKQILFATAILVACATLHATASEVQDETFARVIEIDNQINSLLAERDNLIAQKTDASTVDITAYETKYNDGQYRVGTDIPAGEYVIFSTSAYGGMFKETTDSNGTDKVESDYFDYNVIYTVTEGNYLELKDAFAVPSTDVKEIITNKGSCALKVGEHIPAGEYQLLPTSYLSGGSYTIYKNSLTGDRENKIDSSYFSSPTYITIHDGEYLYIDNALFIE